MLVYVLLFVCWLVYWTFKKQSKEKLPVSFPGALPFIGHAHLLFGDARVLWNRVKDISRFSLSQGGVTYVRLGSQIFYVVCDTDDYITVVNSCLEKNYFYRKILNSWVGDGMVTASVEVWKRSSKLLSPAFNKQVINAYLGIYNSQAKSLTKNLAKLSRKGLFDPKVYLRQAVMEGNFLTTFGLELNEEVSHQMNQYMKSVDELTRALTQRMQTIWMQNDTLYGWSQTKRKEDEALKIINSFSYQIMAQKREAMRNGSKKLGKFKGFLDLVLEMSENGALNDRQIQDQVNTISFAGYRTISTTMILMLVVIGSYPDVQSRIRKELEEVFAGTKEDINTEDLSKLVYLEAVIKEICRLYPVAPVIIRHVDKDVQLSRPMSIINMKITLAHLLRRYKVTADVTKLQLDLHVTLEPTEGYYISLESIN